MVNNTFPIGIPWEVSDMFFGEYHHKVDSQGRVTLPPRCRHRFREGIALYHVSKEGFVAGCATTGTASRNGRSTLPVVFQRSPDTRGRITIPRKLRQVAEIQDTAVILVLDDYLELWGEKKWKLEEARIRTEAVATYQEHLSQAD